MNWQDIYNVNTSTEILLDTNVLVHAVRGNEIWQHVKHVTDPLMRELRPAYSIVTEAKVRSFSVVNKWGHLKQEQAEFLLGYFKRIDINTSESIAAYAKIDAYNRERGVRIGKNDL